MDSDQLVMEIVGSLARDARHEYVLRELLFSLVRLSKAEQAQQAKQEWLQQAARPARNDPESILLH